MHFFIMTVIWHSFLLKRRHDTFRNCMYSDLGRKTWCQISMTEGLFQVSIGWLICNHCLTQKCDSDSVLNTECCHSSAHRRSTVDVIVEIHEVNRNPPIFGPVVYIETVSESLPIGSSVLRVTATDADPRQVKTVRC